jgi:hypothetical protein
MNRRDSNLPDQAQVKEELDEAIDIFTKSDRAVNLFSNDESDVIDELVSITTYSYFSNYLILTLSILLISLSTLFLYTQIVSTSSHDQKEETNVIMTTSSTTTPSLEKEDDTIVSFLVSYCLNL